MSNDYYTPSGTPATGAFAASAPMRSEFNSVEDGFDKLPTLSGNAGKAVIINAGATALSVTTGTLTLAGNFATSGASALTLTTTASTNVTLPTTGTLATLAGTETLDNKTLVAPVLGVATATSINFGQDALDYYDVGAFTPTVTGSATPGSATYSEQLGRFIRVGKIVHYWASITLTSKGGLAGAVRFGGLPFASAAGSASFTGEISWASNCTHTADYKQWGVVIGAGNQFATFTEMGKDGAAAIGVADTGIADNSAFIISGSYEAA